jgi:serine/threonine protein kinase
MGTVYKGRDLLKVEACDKNPFVALKVLNEDFKKHPDAFIALQREASRQQRLAHPNIATVYDFDRSGNTVFLTMEFLEGQPLNTYMRRHVRPRGGLPFAQAYPIIRGLGLALSYAHERDIVHSDFKPANCFITTSGTVKVLDFGIARAIKGQDDGEKSVFDPSRLGALTPAYASPEMLTGEDPDPRDDVYALACLAYELLSGQHPFDRKSATHAREKKMTPAPIRGLTRAQMRALTRALSLIRAKRTSSVNAFLEELKGARSRIRPVWWIVAVAAVLALALVAVLALKNHSATIPAEPPAGTASP